MFWNSLPLWALVIIRPRPLIRKPVATVLALNTAVLAERWAWLFYGVHFFLDLAGFILLRDHWRLRFSIAALGDWE